jgi:midasin (ATPase involved in ribosome maturation)
LGRQLRTINCHATTDTADLLGGLRPVRGRTAIATEILDIAVDAVSFWSETHLLTSLNVPFDIEERLERRRSPPPKAIHYVDPGANALSAIIAFLKDICTKASGIPTDNSKKRIKLENGKMASGTILGFEEKQLEVLTGYISSIECLFKRYTALFEWSDGPLVQAMKAGDFLLLDEISLAEDAVLERLNSVLESSRTLVLAEKGAVNGTENAVIKAEANFHLFATMNPGGDFGKRELSPALRNRFTEIWVPPIEDWSDVDMVLSRALPSALVDRLQLKDSMMKYIQWFNESICNDNLSSLSELSLSVRDALSWAEFIVSVRTNGTCLNTSDLLRHGARLMHLDGLGLGTGISLYTSSEARLKAELFMSAQLGAREEDIVECSFSVTGGLFGKRPFWIPVGMHPVTRTAFYFDAPTTSINVMRILRGLQLSKPILLEGPPGVGKTSLCASLAAASGHKLVRINLSEQTDLSDLIGSDLPVSKRNKDDPKQPNFQWCDGVLLSAIKAGDWVLLDELNLASQTVLEGLNSCLDHRASIFIPELGRTFDCPSSFRVFAAQNPLAQGGGRKGLPKSFLNRFTKVYMDSLSEEDMYSIVSSRFPSICESRRRQMVDFNKHIQEATETSIIGQSGSPWEFNLRDVFRWCELVSANQDLDDESCARSARDLYYQRFRSQEDRAAVDSRFSLKFGRDIASLRTSDIDLGNSEIRIGPISLGRRYGIDLALIEAEEPEQEVNMSSKSLFETVSRCVAMNWPTLLVSRSGKSAASAVGSLADFTCVKVLEISLSPSSDVSELVGGFQQIDVSGEYYALVQKLEDFALHFCVSRSNELVKVASLLNKIHGTSMEDGIASARALALLISQLAEPAHADVAADIFSRLSDGDSFAETLCSKGMFEWKDGPLVEAMTKGYWLHLKNVNLCPATVLDRLNSVMEPGGCLLLTECANDDGPDDSSNRYIYSHPNFRIFLSMNPENGEISRAMRNRCVELSCIDELESKTKQFEGIQATWKSGVRAPSLATQIVRRVMHSGEAVRTEPNFHETVEQIGRAVTCLCQRGVSRHIVFASSGCLYERYFEADGELNVTVSQGFPFVSIREDWLSAPGYGRIFSDARLLQLFISREKPLPTLNQVLMDGYTTFGRDDFMKGSTVLEEKYDRILDSIPLNGKCATFRNHLILLFFRRGSRDDILSRAKFVASARSRSAGKVAYFFLEQFRNISYSLDKVADRLTIERIVSLAEELDRPDPYNKLCSVQFQRLVLEAEKNVCIYAAKKRAMNPALSANANSMSVLEASTCIADGVLGRSMGACQVTPYLYPFFEAVDEILSAMTTALRQQEYFHQANFVNLVISALKARDEFYSLLVNLRFRPVSEGIGFDDSEFIVLWTLLRGCINSLTSSISNVGLDGLATDVTRRLYSIIEMIDASIFDNDEDSIGSSVIASTFGVVVPKLCTDWTAMMVLKESVDVFSVAELLRNDAFISLGDLIGHRHAILFASATLKRDTLIAFCTLYLTSSKEIMERVFQTPTFDLTMSRGLARSLENERKSFCERLESITIDPDATSTDHVLMSVSELAICEDNGLDFVEVTAELLKRFSKIQLSPLVESLCETIEKNCLREICYLCLTPRNNVEQFNSCLMSIRKSLKGVIDLALKDSTWTAVDLRPHQILSWVCEVINDTSEALVSTLILSLSSASLTREISGSRRLFDSMSFALEFPLLLMQSEAKITKRLPKLKLGACRHDMASANTFALLSNEFLTGTSKKTIFATIENFQAREDQLKNVVTLLAEHEHTYKACAKGPWELNFLLVDLLTSLGACQPQQDNEELVLLLKDPSKMASTEDMKLQSLVNRCTNPVFSKLRVTVVHPLLRTLAKVWRESFRRNASLDESFAKVYLGLLRFHLFIPDSPLDPGLKPLAHVKIIDRRIAAAKLELAAMRLDSAVSSGDSSPRGTACCELLNECEDLNARRTIHEQKIIERPRDRPSFRELYRETKAFAKGVMKTSTVLALLDLQTSEDPTKILRRINHWQGTSTAFCNRLVTKYAVYEDVVLPLIQTVGFVQVGLADLVAGGLKPEKGQSPVTYTDMLKFPMVNFESQSPVRGCIKMLGYYTVETRCKIGLALLSRLVIERKATENGSLLNYWLAVTDVVLGDFETKSLTNEKSQLPGVDFEELEYRKQFPDHRESFKDLHNENDDTESVASDSTMDLDRIENKPTTIRREEIEILAALHRDMFLPTRVDDRLRTEAFRCSINASFELFQSTGPEKDLFDSSGLMMAISLCTVDGHISLLASKRHECEPDFHRDPMPDESSKAADPLNRVLGRVTFLLKAFPGNSLLVSIAKVIDRVLKFDIFAVSLGKVMVGLELILQNAQEWEQHASARVKIGQSLKLISQLVSRWRKLELKSWPGLLRVREGVCAKRARGYWASIYSLLRPRVLSARILLDQNKQSQLIIPSWVWKKCSQEAQDLFSTLPNTCAFVADAVKMLDTFILTSCVGEFPARLQLLASFASQLDEETQFSIDSERISLARSVMSLWMYYNQFASFVVSRVESLRRPIEKRLSEETKLAKWDEQSYYSLTESTERNHRKLMRILREYDDVLHQNVGNLLESDVCRGIRSADTESVESSSTMPSKATLFPFTCTEQWTEPVKRMHIDFSRDADWTDASLVSADVTNFASNIRRYALKMDTMYRNFETRSTTTCSAASEQVAELTSAVFERIELLRSEKTSRQMKERALADLLKELKAQGYSASKWNNPNELNQLSELFQLPSLSGSRQDHQSAELTSADYYYQRCLSELIRFRGEALSGANTDLTKRQTDMMVAFAESGMFILIQQRAALSSVLSVINSLRQKLLNVTLDGEVLPLKQSLLVQRVQVYERSRCLFIEAKAQLLLLLRSCTPLIHQQDQQHKFAPLHIFIEKLDLIDSQKERLSENIFVTQNQLKKIEDDLLDLRSFATLLSTFCVECAGIFPTDAVDTTLSALRTSIDDATLCTESFHSLDRTDQRIQPFFQCLSQAVETMLISVQSIRKRKVEEPVTIAEFHNNLMQELAVLNLAVVETNIDSVVLTLKSLHDDCAVSEGSRNACTGLTSDLWELGRRSLSIAEKLVSEASKFHREASKFQYVLLRVFRVLVSQGFCSDDSKDSADNENGDGSGKTFEDTEGTGMGEGDGCKDVTDQIEDEEQLLGLKSDKADAGAPQEEQKQLDKEEAEKGMEMEGDFDGEMYDLPDNGDDKNELDDEGEELDREMGDESGPNEQVIDEAMWDESDNEDGNQGEEKFEEDSGVKGNSAEDEMITRDKDDEAKAPDETNAKPRDAETTPDATDDVNDDLNDKYEENHGVGVRRDEEDEKVEEENDMELGDNLELDEETEQDPVEKPENDNDSKLEDTPEEENQSEFLPQDANEPVEESAPEPEDVDNVGSTEGTIPDSEEQGLQSEEKEKHDNEPEHRVSKDDSDHYQGLGVNALDGNDAVEGAMEEDEGEVDGEGDDAEGDGDGPSEGNPSAQGGTSGGNGGTNVAQGSTDGRETRAHELPPNPLKNPGDASKYWHRKLNIVEKSSQSEEAKETGVNNVDINKKGDFEHAESDDIETTQALGEIEQNDAFKVDHEMEEIEAESQPDAKEKRKKTDNAETSVYKNREGRTKKAVDTTYTDSTNIDESDADPPADESEISDDDGDSITVGGEGETLESTENKIVSDLSQLQMASKDSNNDARRKIIEETKLVGRSSKETSDAQAHWAVLQSGTYHLSRRLCEKLRLVMEPLVASKLRGDYRTGKRINMKRVIGYIASGYRKDKIWLRRTKPAKRNYRVLVAVDDSESMIKSGAGEMALKALATLALGMSHLEIGEIGIAKFGEEMELLHAFDKPFTAESGPKLVGQFQFNQQRTRTALCIESTIRALADTPGAHASMQLVFMISDGRIERDSRTTLRKLIRELTEQNILLALIIVEGDKKKDSILSMKEVSFDKGKPVVKRFIEDYPFPYYVVLGDVQALPEVLGDALRQWFEMLARLQAGTS